MLCCCTLVVWCRLTIVVEQVNEMFRPLSHEVVKELDDVLLEVVRHQRRLQQRQQDVVEKHAQFDHQEGSILVVQHREGLQQIAPQQRGVRHAHGHQSGTHEATNEQHAARCGSEEVHALLQDVKQQSQRVRLALELLALDQTEGHRFAGELCAQQGHHAQEALLLVRDVHAVLLRNLAQRARLHAAAHFDFVESEGCRGRGTRGWRGERRGGGIILHAQQAQRADDGSAASARGARSRRRWSAGRRGRAAIRRQLVLDVRRMRLVDVVQLVCDLGHIGAELQPRVGVALEALDVRLDVLGREHVA